MNLRHAPTADAKDKGFTLIELLVVMIIIGILAAIAIPVFLSQREKAADTAAKSDVARLGKELAAYYVDGTATVYATYVGTTTPATALLGTTVGASDINKVILSDGTWGPGALGAISVTYLPTTATGCTSLGLSGRWNVGLTNKNGSGATYFYGPAQGLTKVAPTAC